MYALLKYERNLDVNVSYSQIESKSLLMTSSDAVVFRVGGYFYDHHLCKNMNPTCKTAACI